MLAVIGGSLVGLSLLSFVAAADDGAGVSGESVFVGGVLGLTGAIMTAVGLGTWSSSRSAADDTSLELPVPVRREAYSPGYVAPPPPPASYIPLPPAVVPPAPPATQPIPDAAPDATRPAPGPPGIEKPPMLGEPPGIFRAPPGNSEAPSANDATIRAPSGNTEAPTDSAAEETPAP